MNKRRVYKQSHAFRTPGKLCQNSTRKAQHLLSALTSHKLKVLRRAQYHLPHVCKVRTSEQGSERNPSAANAEHFQDLKELYRPA